MSEDMNKENVSGKKLEGISLGAARHGCKSNAGLAKKSPKEIPLLWFGHNNNFHKFHEALLNAAL